MDLFLKIILGPLLLFQGRRIRKTIPRLPEPEGEREGRTADGPLRSLLILGDSSAAGVGAASQEEALLGNLRRRLRAAGDWEWVLHARTGARTENMLNRLSRIDERKFDVVLSVFGVNDITAGVPLKTWLAQQDRLIDGICARFGDPLVVVSGFPPVGSFPALPNPLRWYLGRTARRYDAALKNLAERKGCLFVPIAFEGDVSMMASDGFHPGPKVYELWSHALSDAILPRLDDA